MIEEGAVKIIATEINERGPGRAKGVFYNRAMVFNRDTTIFLLSNMRVRNALDALAATGVRGLRIAKELGINTTINDVSKDAYRFIKKNAELNEVSVTVKNRDANALMAEERYDYVDIDPFGTPVYFIDMALRCGKILGITATDTATLSGRNKKVIRRYLSTLSTPAPYAHEIGVRNLLGYIGRMAVRYDLGIKPIFSFWYGHFYRVYVRILKGSHHAKRTLENIGMCEYGGPVWIAHIHDFDFLNRARIPEHLPTYKLLDKYLNLWRQEKTFLFYHLPSIASDLKTSMPSVKYIIESLRDKGFEAYRTHFSTQGIKTNASKDVLCEIMKSYFRKI